MAFFGVTLEQLESVSPHPNADRLEVGKLQGMDFLFVLPKGVYKANDDVVYIPIDSVLPEDLMEVLGVAGRLSGKNKDRLKTVTLRGVMSQGLVASVETIATYLEMSTKELLETEWTDVTRNDIEGNPTIDTNLLTCSLGINKYETEPKPCQAGKLVALPTGQSAYDIEDGTRYAQVLDAILSEKSWITEKLEGSNFSVTYLASEDRVVVNQRNYSIEPIEGAEHDYWKLARKYDLLDRLLKFGRKSSYDMITIYGEAIGPGIQGNYYGLKSQEIKIFDVKCDMEWAGLTAFRNILFNNLGLDESISVPVLCDDLRLSEWLDGRTLTEAAHGPSVLCPDKIREGIVIKPVYDLRLENFGRVILKKRDPIYLDKTGN